MNIVEFLDKLDNISSWRKKELSQAHFLAQNSNSKDAESYLCRVWIMIMYAHCDSFLKEVAKVYLEFIKTNPDANYKPELMWLVMRGKKNLINGSYNTYTSLDAYHKIHNNIHFSVIESNDVFKLKSFQYKSLRFFCDWILQIDYDHQQFSVFCKQLKSKRDSIAHGEKQYVDLANDCLPFQEKVIQFMDSLKDSIIENCLRSA